MESPELTLLRLHVEAVWGVRVPPLTQKSVDLWPEGTQPPWKLYLANVAEAQVAVFRPDTVASEREGLLARAREAFTISELERIAPPISREVVFRQTAAPTGSLVAAHQLARLLTPDDQALIEAFDPGYLAYYFHPDRRPLIGVIVEGRLLSLAHSSRRTQVACELGIDTRPEARRHGYALAATLLWEAEVTREGLIPFYSAFAENTASLRLAAAAGYRAFAHAVIINA